MAASVSKTTLPHRKKNHVLTVHYRNHIYNVMNILRSIPLPALCIPVLLLSAYAEQTWDEGDDFQSYTSEPDPAEPEGSAAEQDATYVIKKGDTLWDLAFEFLGDPFQWPRIWELNRYISNPDLIYPGNRLVIPGRFSTVPATTGNGDDDFSSETEGALDETAALADSLESSSDYPGDSLLLSSLRNKEILSDRYLSTVPYLWTEKDQHGNIYPGNAEVDPPESGASYQLFSEMSITPFKGAHYREGDTIDIFNSLRIVRFNKVPANLIKKVGRARIQKSSPEKIHALLFEMSDAISGKERITPFTPFSTLKVDTLVKPSITLSANIFLRVEETESPYPFQMIILDKGSMQGVELGDVFGIYYRKDKKDPVRLSAIGTVGHVGAASSTVNIVSMYRNLISEGNRAVLLRRARFSEKE